MRSQYIKGNGRGHPSDIVEALRRLEGEISVGTAGADPSGLFGHTVIIQTGDVTIRNDGLDCEFDIPFDDDTEANEAEIVVYNLSDLTVQNIKAGERITVTAGYGADTGVIFNGIISKPKTFYSGLDRVTEIHAIDHAALAEREVQSISYAAGTPASRILQDLVGMVGLPVAAFSLKRDHVFKDKATVDGGLMENIRRYAGICGVSAYVCKSQVYVRHITEGDPTEFQLSPDTGLLELSEFEEEQTAEDFVDVVHGYEMKMLLQHRVTTASLINLKARAASGVFRVREGSHTYDGTEFMTKVKAIECPQQAPVGEAEAAPAGQAGLPDLSGYSGVSIVDGLKSAGVDSSYAYRKTLAEQLGIRGYSGTAGQNLEMLRKLGGKVG